MTDSVMKHFTKQLAKKSVGTSLGRIAYLDTGKTAARTLVFWPSLLMTAELWQAQIESFSDRYRVIAVDPPGHGDSEALQQVFTMEQCADALLECMDAWAVDRAVLVGNSWGAMLGAVFASRHPERIDAAVLINGTAAKAPLKQRLEFRLMVALLKRMRKVPGWLSKKAVTAFAGETSEREQPQLIADIDGAVRRCRPKSVAYAIDSVVIQRRDQHSALKQVRCPTLIVAGEEDRTFPPSETYGMAEAISHAEWHQLAQVGHLAAREAPEQINQLIQAVLNDLDQRSN